MFQRWMSKAGVAMAVCAAALTPSEAFLLSPSVAPVSRGRVVPGRTCDVNGVSVGLSLRRSHLGGNTGLMGLRAQESEMEGGVFLPTDIDYDKQAAWIAEEVRLWLDEEWIEREVHRDIGLAAGDILKTARTEKGMHDATGLLFEIADGLATFDFYEADVNNWDIGNKCSDLLLQALGKDVCCTSPPKTTPDFSKDNVAASTGAPGKVLDGRATERVVNHAVLDTLGFKAEAVDGQLAYVSTGVDGVWKEFQPYPDFMSDLGAIETLDKVLQEALDEQNRKDEDIDGLIEALHGEQAVQVAKERQDLDFLKRETCVKFLHAIGGY